MKFTQIQAMTNYYKFSFFPSSDSLWNPHPREVTEAQELEQKDKLAKMYLNAICWWATILLFNLTNIFYTLTVSLCLLVLLKLLFYYPFINIFTKHVPAIIVHAWTGGGCGGGGVGDGGGGGGWVGGCGGLRSDHAYIEQRWNIWYLILHSILTELVLYHRITF